MATALMTGAAGAVVSIVTTAVAEAALALPAWSVIDTLRLCAPSTRVAATTSL